MKKLNLQYTEDTSVKGYIDIMIITRKYELGKVINKQAGRTHQNKILETRLKEDKTEVDNVLPKKI